MPNSKAAICRPILKKGGSLKLLTKGNRIEKKNEFGIISAQILK